MNALWAVGQVLLLPIALGRVYHDVVQWAMAELVTRDRGADVEVDWRGYRPMWAVRGSETVSRSGQWFIVASPALVALGGLGLIGFVAYPTFRLAAETSLAFQIAWVWFWLNYLAFALPTLRDLHALTELHQAAIETAAPTD